jgi:lipopolysaccharide transport system ATP-binding protein
MTSPVISVRRLSKRYRLGTIDRHTIADEVSYWWHRARRRDPRAHMGLIRSGDPAAGEGPPVDDTLRNREFWALHDVSFDVQAGEVVGVIGRNGAGKSTLLKVLSRITEPSAGEVVLEGRVGSLLEVGTGFHPELTGRENVYLNGTILGMKKREIDARFDEIVAFAEIEKFLETPVKRYSSGMYVRLAFAVAAHLQPAILLVDEVLAVGDVNFQRKCMGKMTELASSGRTILFVSHQMNAVRRMCSRCLLIDDGRVCMDDSANAVVSAYESGRSSGSMAATGAPDAARAAHQDAIYFEWSVRSPRGDSSHSFSGLGEVVIEARFHLRRPVPRAHCGLTLRDHNHLLICSWAQQGLDLRPGTIAFRFAIPTLPLRPGLYYLQFSLFEGRQRLDLWDAVPPLRIDTPPQDSTRDEWSGVLELPCRFSVVEAGSAATPGERPAPTLDERCERGA